MREGALRREGPRHARDRTLVVPALSPQARPDPDTFPAAPVTRFAPAPTGYLHLGHLVNALYVWGIARATGGRVLLRIEDHDRQRSRPEFERALLEDLERLNLQPDEPSIADFRRGPTPWRQSDAGSMYADAAERLAARGLLYACDCARSRFAAYQAATERPWRGPGCPGGCRERHLRDDGAHGLRVAVGTGVERWTDVLGGERDGEPAEGGDLLARDRRGNWTYAFCVVVDDMRHAVSLVIRGRDLLEATPAQLRLARLLGRAEPPHFLHHPLVRRVSGQKLSKAEGDTSVRSMLDAGSTPGELFARAARLAGLRAEEGPLEPEMLAALFSPDRPPRRDGMR
jgi:glutamyl/glutaminyl-tRNA synthetase